MSWPKMSWTKIMAILGVISAAVNMALAWTFLFQQASPSYGLQTLATTRVEQSVQKTPPPPPPPGQATVVQVPLAEPDPLGGFGNMLERSMPVWAASSMSDARIVFAKCGIAFVLISLGFSFFMIGIESVKVTEIETPWVILRSTSPGIICFICGTLVLAVPVWGISQPTGGREVLDQARVDYEDARTETERARADLLQAQADRIRDSAFADPAPLSLSPDLKPE